MRGWAQLGAGQARRGMGHQEETEAAPRKKEKVQVAPDKLLKTRVALRQIVWYPVMLLKNLGLSNIIRYE
jgi:hypothetical protein